MTVAYSSELTTDQWELLSSLLPASKPGGRPRHVNLKFVVQAILYLLVSGCAWRLLPKDYPPSSTVYYYFSQWRDDGTWKRIHDQLVTWCRVEQGRHPSPSAGSLDSQSVPTAVMVHHQVGLSLIHI